MERTRLRQGWQTDRLLLVMLFNRLALAPQTGLATITPITHIVSGAWQIRLLRPRRSSQRGFLWCHQGDGDGDDDIYDDDDCHHDHLSRPIGGFPEDSFGVVVAIFATDLIDIEQLTI